jgi:RNA polymerase sigma factor (sigma-70 family)
VEQEFAPIMSPRVSIRLLPSQSDGRLVELAGRGQEDAFETLVRRYRRPLLRYCRRMGLSDTRAEDVLQHSLTKAWLALSQGNEVREVRPWLYRIVHNDAINVVSRAPAEHEELTDATASSSYLEHDLESRLQVRDALAHVASLPQMQRNAMVMTAIEGRSHDEAALALGITDGAVRGLIHRARTTLRSAAAAVLPPGLLRWPGRGSEGLGLGERASELTIGGGVVGAGGVLFKGAAITASVGLLALGASVEHSTPHPKGTHVLHSRGQAADGAISTTSSVGLTAATSDVAAARAIGRVRGHTGGERRGGHGGHRRGGGFSGGDGSSVNERSSGERQSNDGGRSRRDGSEGKDTSGSGSHDGARAGSGGDGSSSSGSGSHSSGGDSASAAEDGTGAQGKDSSGGPTMPVSSASPETSSGPSGDGSGSTRGGSGSTGPAAPGGESQTSASDGGGGD